MEERTYAHPFDRRTDGVSVKGRGRYFGDGWYEYFLDRHTGKKFRVRCSDGIGGGKGAFPDHVCDWHYQCYIDITERVRAEAADDAQVIRLSEQEWIICIYHDIHGWRDPKPGEGIARADKTITLGQIGTINGIPIVVDPVVESFLPLIPECNSSPCHRF